jgi:hypothetical protein
MRGRFFSREAVWRIVDRFAEIRRFATEIHPATRRKIAKLGVEFFLESAVLVFVFPVLDSIIKANGKPVVTKEIIPIILWSWAVSPVLFTFAVIVIILMGGDEQ